MTDRPADTPPTLAAILAVLTDIRRDLAATQRTIVNPGRPCPSAWPFLPSAPAVNDRS